MAHPGPLDLNERGYRTMRQVTDKHDETIAEEIDAGDPNRVAAGQKGAAARNRKLTPEERSEIAKRAAEARWSESEESESDE